MKKFSLLYSSLLISVIALFWSCQKEPLQTAQKNNEQNDLLARKRHDKEHKPLKGHLATFFNFVPDVANGWTPPNPAPAWYPGGGGGNLTIIGNCQTFFNQYATLGPTGLQTVFAPVNMFFTVPLSAAGITASDKVSIIFFTANGQSIWGSAIGASTTTPVSPTRVEFTAINKIIGGTGKFHDAEGKFTIKGFFNPQNPQDAGFDVDGWIEED